MNLSSCGHTVFMEKNFGIRTFDFYVILFFLLSFIGWLWEAAIYLVTEQVFVNRGIYLGPYLPIYGVGGLLLWFLLHRLTERPGLTFFLSAFVCSVLEYLVSYLMEWKWGLRWWDYSSYFLNLNGRICFLSVMAFGLAGMALNCLLMPCYMSLYHKMSKKLRLSLTFVLLALFIADATYCAVRPHVGENIAFPALG